MLAALGLIAIGLVLLVFGGEWLVKGASRLANVAGISPLVIGLTVVSFGTSAPELAVALNATHGGSPDIAIGNIVGSNIFNVLFILGVSAMIAPLIVTSRLIRLDVPLMVAASIAVFLMGLDGTIGRVDGIILFGSLLIYLGYCLIASKKESQFVKEEFEQEYGKKPNGSLRKVIWNLLLIIAGLVMLTFGSRWLVDGATTTARMFGMSELLIGLTIVAVGTSLPEVAASVIASVRGERDIAVGNVVGSNLFNLLCVLGLSSIVTSQGVAVSESALRLDLPIMIAVAFACLPIFFTGRRIDRWEGCMFFGYYLAYTIFLVLAGANHSYSTPFGWVIVGFVVPLTAITLLVGVYRSIRESRRLS